MDDVPLGQGGRRGAVSDRRARERPSWLAGPDAHIYINKMYRSGGAERGTASRRFGGYFFPGQSGAPLGDPHGAYGTTSGARPYVAYDRSALRAPVLVRKAHIQKPGDDVLGKASELLGGGPLPRDPIRRPSRFSSATSSSCAMVGSSRRSATAARSSIFSRSSSNSEIGRITEVFSPASLVMYCGCSFFSLSMRNPSTRLILAAGVAGGELGSEARLATRGRGIVSQDTCAARYAGLGAGLYTHLTPRIFRPCAPTPVPLTRPHSPPPPRGLRGRGRG
jgi:hypothetical protein